MDVKSLSTTSTYTVFVALTPVIFRLWLKLVTIPFVLSTFGSYLVREVLFPFLDSYKSRLLLPIFDGELSGDPISRRLTLLCFDFNIHLPHLTYHFCRKPAISIFVAFSYLLFTCKFTTLGTICNSTAGLSLVLCRSCLFSYLFIAN